MSNDRFDISDLDQDILGFEIGMNNAAFAMEVVKAKQDLLCYLFDEVHGYASVVPSLDEAKQVFS